MPPNLPEAQSRVANWMRRDGGSAGLCGRAVWCFGGSSRATGPPPRKAAGTKVKPAGQLDRFLGSGGYQNIRIIRDVVSCWDPSTLTRLFNTPPHTHPHTCKRTRTPLQTAHNSLHNRRHSPAALDAALIAAAMLSLGVNRPATSEPSATMHAPVRVAMSITAWRGGGVSASDSGGAVGCCWSGDRSQDGELLRQSRMSTE